MPRHALVAEDDEPIRRLIAKLLERQGLAVRSAKNGREALTALDEVEFDVIVLDLMMPEVSGFEVLHEMRARRPESLKCLIVVTAVPDRELVRILGEDPAFRILRKPFDTRELERAVSECLLVQRQFKFLISCLSCDVQQSFLGPSEKEAREEARSKGWHVVSFVKEDTATGKKKTLFITFCPTCASPETDTRTPGRPDARRT